MVAELLPVAPSSQSRSQLSRRQAWYSALHRPRTMGQSHSVSYQQQNPMCFGDLHIDDTHRNSDGCTSVVGEGTTHKH